MHTEWQTVENLIGHLQKQSYFDLGLHCLPRWHVGPVWSESSLCTQWVAKDPNFLHADSEESDQTGRRPRLIWVFAGHAILLVLARGGSNYTFILLHTSVEISTSRRWERLMFCFRTFGFCRFGINVISSVAYRVISHDINVWNQILQIREMQENKRNFPFGRPGGGAPLRVSCMATQCLVKYHQSFVL